MNGIKLLSHQKIDEKLNILCVELMTNDVVKNKIYTKIKIKLTYVPSAQLLTTNSHSFERTKTTCKQLNII